MANALVVAVMEVVAVDVVIVVAVVVAQQSKSNCLNETKANQQEAEVAVNKHREAGEETELSRVEAEAGNKVAVADNKVAVADNKVAEAEEQ
jgi:hypothetical protein